MFVCMLLTNTDAKDSSVDGEHTETVVMSYKRRCQSTEDKIHAEHRLMTDKAQISDETHHDAHRSVGDTHDENQHSRLAGAKTNLELTEVRQVDERDCVRDVGEKVTDSEHNEKKVGQ